MIYRKILRYIVFLMIYFDISLIYRDISAIYWGHFFQISKKYPEISSNISPIYRDISKYIAIYRDISLDISRYCLSGQNVSYNQHFYSGGENHEFWVTGSVQGTKRGQLRSMQHLQCLFDVCNSNFRFSAVLQLHFSYQNLLGNLLKESERIPDFQGNSRKQRGKRSKLGLDLIFSSKMIIWTQKV